ncbi:flavodoxin family protein [Elizabethkingia anophelis]|uniref:General stress protein n=1 Tax=Elizabethkingia anophelis TaxID=1117645 RepID=A0AAU8USU8_9FLAO|nr:NAD(P)H-dependent oxidoreductase [Elizabethkingia anophelis]AQW94450.1 general stress protein [Elizabethkingia anophelis]AQX00779.1 general stress protein [Elizabethkingia anophelis]MCL1033124.1 NAD(P)H-dependent oxidoreductase [Elizabethkingia anophelis]MCL1691784.1 NAD(P)H-dependent oxidoreductase [Elizabethkingia anophelis]MCW2462894.1 putative NADPH-quinone reductase [Elizabethkingia anophelis]
MALIILGHPDWERSLANKEIVNGLVNSEVYIEVRHLQQLYPDFKIDIKKEQEALLRHKNIVFQFPFYWYTMPAILKQWFDLVLEYGFAYGSTGDKLKGKNFIPSFTVGSAENEYKTLGEHHFRILEFCKNLEQTAYYTQMNYIEPLYFYGTSLNAGYTEEQVKNKAKEQTKKLAELLKTLE